MPKFGKKSPFYFENSLFFPKKSVRCDCHTSKRPVKTPGAVQQLLGQKWRAEEELLVGEESWLSHGSLTIQGLTPNSQDATEALS